MGSGNGVRRLGWRGTLVVVALAAILAAILAACHGDRGSQIRLQVGTFWVGAAAEALREELLLACEELDIAGVEMHLLSLRSLRERLLTDSVEDHGSQMDLALVPNDWLGVLTDRMLIGELPAHQADELRESVVTEGLLAVSQGERLFAYPVSAEALGLVYNPKFLPREPRYLDDIFATRLPIGVIPFSMDVGSLYHLAPLLACYQGSLVSLEGSFVWSPAAATTLFRSLAPVWSDLPTRSVATATDPDSLHIQLFAEERLASFIAGPWLVPALAKLSSAFAVAPVPPFRNAPHPARALVGYQSLVVIRQSPWSGFAHTVALRLLSTEVQARLARRSARLPVVRKAFTAEGAALDVASVGFLRAIESGQAMPSSSRWEHDFRNAAERVRAMVRAHKDDPLESLLSDMGQEAP